MYILYGKPMCSSCNDAKAFLDIKGIDYLYLSLGKDYQVAKIHEINNKHRSFPMVTKVVSDTEEYIGTLEDLKNHVNSLT